MPPITVMIMTLNEADNIEAAIRSFPEGTKVVVYDSYSTDGTAEKAAGLGARVIQRKFDNWAAHQNWGAKNIDFGNPWVYYSDADERMTPELWSEISAALDAPGEAVAFDMRRKDMFLGRWIKRSSFYPCWFTRVYRPEKIRWERLVNPVSVVDGETGRLKEHFIHYPFSKGISFWFERHIKYADFEAQEMLRVMCEGVQFGKVFSSDRQERRRALKRIFYKMPFRPLIKFFVLYFLRRGFLDGRAGFYYAIMQSNYEFMISLRAREIQRLAKGLPV
jgi:glycosyltransferase involved in cell wall biosynthesis